MKSDFLLAITQLSAEKNLPKEVVIGAVEAALVSAYRKDSFAANQNITVKISQVTGKVQVWAEKTVVETPIDTRREISLDEARRIKKDAQLDELIMVESTPANAGRIAAQTAKQVILQRLHEAENTAIIEEYAGKEGDISTGVVQRIDPRQVYIDMGRTEAVLPAVERIPNERYRVGQRIRVYMLEVARTARGPRVIVSRSHPNLLRRLFEMEVPEIFSGAVEIKAIAREAGSRSKVAVTSKQEGVDPVGCCVGLRGIRIQNIVNELSGEKIDVVAWSPDSATFIANALSPAQIVSVSLNKGEQVATVTVPDRQLSLAIGKEGQNVRLAAKLSGWRIDIKSATAMEAEKAARAAETGATKEVTAEAEPVVEARKEEAVPEPVMAEAKAVTAEAPAQPEAEPVPAEPVLVSPVPMKMPEIRLRFSEDLGMGGGPAKPQAATAKKKKKKAVPGRDDDAVKFKKRRKEDIGIDEEEVL